jgi:hypothetical protein
MHTSNDLSKDPQLEALIKDVKVKIRKSCGVIEEQIQRTGNFLKEKKLVKERDICVEIKSYLKEEIEDQMISARTIDRCCPDEWKRKTKPKKERQMSFFEDKKELEEGIVTNNTAVEMSSQFAGTTLLHKVGDSNSNSTSNQGEGVGNSTDTKSDDMHNRDSPLEVSKRNKDLLSFKFFILRSDLWERIIKPASHQRGEEMVCINAVLDKRTGIATIVIE